MTPLTLAVLGGSGAGLGAAMLLRAWRPAPEPLPSALDRIIRPASPARTIHPDVKGFVRWGQLSGGWLADRLAAAPRNASTRVLPGFRDYYTDSTRQLVADKDRLFLELFDYRFEKSSS